MASEAKQPLRVLEFFSGIGGMHYAALAAARDVEVVEAFEINHLSNKVYFRNFGKQPRQVGIETISIKKLDSYRADLWLMSPPCQPYSRQGKQLGLDDPRAKSFLHLMHALPQLKNPPTYLLLENVKGFESSAACALALSKLAECGFSVQHFLLTPTQFGIPNLRMRYYLLARRGDAPLPKPHATSDKATLLDTIAGNPHFDAAERDANLPRPLSDFLLLQFNEGEGFQKYRVPDKMLNHPSIWCCDLVDEHSVRSSCFTKAYGKFIRGTGSVVQTIGPELTRKERGLPPLSRRRRQGHVVKKQRVAESGSVELTAAGEVVSKGVGIAKSGSAAQGIEEFGGKQRNERADDGGDDSSDSIHEEIRNDRPCSERGLRFLTPREIANLHCFPAARSEAGPLDRPVGTGTFEFGPEGEVTRRQRYQMLGNSLNVYVVAQLLNHLYDAK